VGKTKLELTFPNDRSNKGAFDFEFKKSSAAVGKRSHWGDTESK